MRGGLQSICLLCFITSTGYASHFECVTYTTKNTVTPWKCHWQLMLGKKSQLLTWLIQLSKMSAEHTYKGDSEDGQSYVALACRYSHWQGETKVILDPVFTAKLTIPSMVTFPCLSDSLKLGRAYGVVRPREGVVSQSAGPWEVIQDLKYYKEERNLSKTLNRMK